MSRGPNYDDGGESGPKTLRDEFAMAALPRCVEVAAQFMIAEPDFIAGTRGLSELMRRAAGYAYNAADAMLEERKK